MAWGSSRRRERFNPGWPKARAYALERDRHMCQWIVEDEQGFPMGICGEPSNTVDHIRHNMQHDDDSPSNLQTLCAYHHNLKTQAESAESKRRNAKKRHDAKFYDHPAFR